MEFSFVQRKRLREKTGRGGRSQWFGFGHVKVEMPNRYSCGDGRWETISRMGNCGSEE